MLQTSDPTLNLLLNALEEVEMPIKALSTIYYMADALNRKDHLIEMLKEQIPG